MQTLKLTKKYERYPEYKDSGVEWIGEMPKDWLAAPMRLIACENTRRNFDGECQNLLSLSYGKIIKKDINSNEGLLPESFNTYQIVKKGNIVFRLTDLQNDKRSLRVGYVGVDEPGIITSAYLALEIGKAVHKKFAYYLFHSYDLQKVYYGMGGGVRQTLDFENFKYLPILLPKIQEQEKIAAYLDEKTVLIDQIIEKKKKLIELLREKRTAVINHAVTKGLDPKAELVESGIPWLREIPKNWRVLPNKAFLKRKKILVSENAGEFDLLSLTRNGIIKRDISGSKGKFSTDEGTYQVVKEGDIVFCLFDIEETPRTVGLSSLKGMISGAYSIFEGNNRTLLRYIEYYYIAMDDNKRLSYLYSGLRNTITPPRFLAIKSPIPPGAEQEEIINFLDKKLHNNDLAIKYIEASVEKLNELKSSLISHVVTGKIKV